MGSFRCGPRELSRGSSFVCARLSRKIWARKPLTPSGPRPPPYLGTDDLNEWLSVSREETVEIDGKKAKLPVGFFPWHVDLYRKRPIFWLLSSEGFEQGKTRFRFQIYLHYLKLTPDTLPRLVSTSTSSR